MQFFMCFQTCYEVERFFTNITRKRLRIFMNCLMMFQIDLSAKAHRLEKSTLPPEVVTNISYMWRIFKQVECKPLQIYLNNIYRRRTYIFIFGIRFIFVNLYMVNLYSYCHLIFPSQILSQLRAVLSTFSKESFYYLPPRRF